MLTELKFPDGMYTVYM